MLKSCEGVVSYEVRRRHAWGHPQFNTADLKITWTCADCGDTWVQYCRVCPARIPFHSHLNHAQARNQAWQGE